MPQYSYSTPSLGADNIRLLRLMPSKDETAPIKCQLHIYPLHKSDTGGHLYEALSYVWGTSSNRHSIIVDGSELQVTENLHSALLHLRNHSFDRIIWIDFICINQADDREKERQIQLMARIYGQADRVIVYLGEAQNNGEEALEHIRAAAEDDSMTVSNSKDIQDAVLKLLARKWFRRIWVLQEVALARRILVMCGSTELNGYAFCSGLNKIELSFGDHPDLRNRIRAATYLMRGAIFRPRFTTESVGGISLGELVDMYHTREATKCHDRVYALLGMSSDGLASASLSPNYALPWKDLMYRLIEFIFPGEMSIEICDNKELAVVKGRGCVLGHVYAVESDNVRYDRQNVSVVFSNALKSQEYEKNYGSLWALQATAKPIRQHDVVCLLEGISKPTIIRPCKDHFAVIIAAVTIRHEAEGSEGQGSMDLKGSYPHNFLLLWNWKIANEKVSDHAELLNYEAPMGINDLVPDYLKTSAEKEARFCDVAIALVDSMSLKEAEMMLQKALEGLEGAYKQEIQRVLGGINNIALAYKHQEKWTEAENLLLQEIQIRKRIQGKGHHDTRNSVADLASTYAAQMILWSYSEIEMAKNLVTRVRQGGPIPEYFILEIIKHMKSSSPKMVVLLLDMTDQVSVTQEVVKAAARSESGDEIMALFLARSGIDINITQEVLMAAAENYEKSFKILTVLLDRRGNDFEVSQKVVQEAARNFNHGVETMTLLLDRCGDQFKITEEILIIAAVPTFKITDKVVKAAARSGSCKIMELLLDRRDDEVHITEEIVESIVDRLHFPNHQMVMTLLLNRRGTEIKITDKMVIAAAKNKCYEMMKLLLDRRGDEVKITDEVVKAVAKDRYNDASELLRERRKDEYENAEKRILG